MTATIRDVANRCGQPIHIVGRILNDYSDISDEVRGQVLQAARELDFPLSSTAPEHLTHNVGVLFVDENYSGLTHPFFAAMLNAFKREVEAMGYDITFIKRNIGGVSATYLEHCRYRKVDGVCLACVDFYSKEVEELLNSDIPCVTVDHPWPTQQCVLSDNANAMHMLLDHAVSLGHQRIAFISGQCNSEVTKQRVEQYYDGMKSHNLSIPKGYYVEGRYGEPEIVRKLVAHLLDRVDRPSCILLPDDTCYFCAQEVARERELRIPADISFAGFDGIALTQSLRPQLTTIRQNSEEMGRQAALKLIQRLEHPGNACMEPVRIPVTLIKGATVGWCEEW